MGNFSFFELYGHKSTVSDQLFNQLTSIQQLFGIAVDLKPLLFDFLG